MEKVIHYCWFGGKPLPKLARKCIKSWKKYLPDFEIKEWNESNFDINCCEFVKQAYENKKWAFVSDYARLYALNQDGGIYLDTDMEIMKNIDFVKDKDFFIGYEENKVIAAGVIGVKGKNNKYIKDLLKVYESKTEFNEETIFDLTIPKIITKEFSKYSKTVENGIDIFNNEIYVYSEEYFYPINYNYSKKNYTDNTCMVHYYNATWAPKEEKIAVTVYRTFGKKLGDKILKTWYKICNIKNYIIGFIKRRMYNLKMFISIRFLQNRRVKRVKVEMEKIPGEYIVISHPDWVGVRNSAEDKFEYNITLREQHTKEEAQKMARAIVEDGRKLVIFNGFANGWGHIAEEIRVLNKDIIIKVMWHGSHALLSEWYDWESYNIIIKLLKDGTINEIGFVKKSLYEFFKAKGYNVSFITNTIQIENKEKYIKKNLNNTMTKIGLYSSGDRWVKNTYNQVSAASLVENAELNCVPLNFKVIELARMFDLQVTGTEQRLSRNEMFEKMAMNDINLYVTFTECAPLIPLESLELGVPCITGDNHHYFEGTELEDYLVVKKEDNIMAIYERIKYVLEHREKIIELYRSWKKEYDIKAKENIENFIKIN